MLTIAIFLAICASSPNSAPDSSHGDDIGRFQGKIISNITIVRHNVFDDMIRNGHAPFYYRWGNALHIKTKERVIKGELLFNAGDPLDSLKIIESERNLRFREFIGEANISAEPNGPDSVDLTVTTVDYWTTKISLYSELGGGDYSIGGAASEVNFLGYGQTIEIAGESGSDHDSYSGYVYDGRIAGSRLAGSFYYSGSTYGNGLLVSFTRPQYSLATRAGYSVKFTDNDAIFRLFHRGDEYFRYRLRHREFDSKMIYSFGKLSRLDLMAGYAYVKRDYSEEIQNSPLNSFIPFDDIRSYPSIGFGLSVIRYGLERYLDEAGTPEDLTLGGGVRLYIGRSFSELGADFIGTRPEISAKILVKPLNRLFLGAKNKLYWWHHEGRSVEIRNRNEILAYLKTGETHVLTARWLTDFAWRQKSTYQVYLGGTNGLRGYTNYRFAGNRLAVGNLEYRFYLPVEILTVRLGGAAFFDIGTVWRRGERIEPKDLKSDVGIGLRFGLTKSSTSRVLRFDVARSLSNKDIFISFGSTVLFSLKAFDSYD